MSFPALFSALILSSWALANLPEEAAPAEGATSAARCEAGDAQACIDLYWEEGREDALERGRALYAQRCEQGDLEGCLWVANALLAGWSQPLDPAPSLAAAQKACRAGSLDGCHTLGLLLRGGYAGAPDLPGAIAAFRKACAGELEYACDELLGMNLAPPGVPASLDTFTPVLARAAPLQAACAGGEGAACEVLGTWFEEKVWGAPALYGTAAAYYAAACERGDALGCVRLDALLQFEDILGETLHIRQRWGWRAAERACEAGSAGSCEQVGRTLFESEDPAEKARGVAYLQRACTADSEDTCAFLEENGLPGRLPGEAAVKRWADVIALNQAACDRPAPLTDPRSCKLLGAMHGDGLWGASPDPAKALTAYARACEAGTGELCSAIGEAYASGDGVSKDEGRALALWRAGCEAHSGRSCLLAAEALQAGRGAKRDKGKAKGLYARACDLGEPEGCAGGRVETKGCSASLRIASSEAGPAEGARCELTVRVADSYACPSECTATLVCGGRTVLTDAGLCGSQDGWSSFGCADQLRSCRFSFTSEGGYGGTTFDLESGYGTVSTDGFSFTLQR